jgi:hypothetical protein
MHRMWITGLLHLLETKGHEAERRTGISVLVLYSKTYPGPRYDVPVV